MFTDPFINIGYTFKAFATDELVFFFSELIKIELPGDYKKESWAMEIDEKLDKVPYLRQEGNKLYIAGQFEEASEKYATAIGYLEQLLLR